MKTTDQADATARALDLLAPGDPAGSDPRLLRDASLAAESRLTCKTAAEIWLAVSPLRVAPPDVLNAVMAEIQPPLPANPGLRRRHLAWLAASGWAAAASLAIFLRPEPVSMNPPTSGKITARAPQIPPEEPAPFAALPTGDTRLKSEISRLKKRLATWRDESEHRTPRVISLSAPGAMRPTPEEAKQRVNSILTNALRSALEAESGAPSDPASLVIERGWLPGGLPFPGDGGVIRHRNFPEEAWQELRLSRSPDGEYYDDSSKTVWFADPEGRGFIGRKITADDDLGRFTEEPDQKTMQPKSTAKPEGFIIEDPADRRTEIFVENVPALADGKQLIARVTDDAGITMDIPLASAGGNSPNSQSVAISLDSGTTFTENGTIMGNFTGMSSVNLSSNLHADANRFSAPYSNIVGFVNGGSVILSFPNGTLPAGFQLLEGSLVPNGQPPTVIVESAP